MFEVRSEKLIFSLIIVSFKTITPYNQNITITNDDDCKFLESIYQGKLPPRLVNFKWNSSVRFKGIFLACEYNTLTILFAGDMNGNIYKMKFQRLTATQWTYSPTSVK